MYDALHVSLPVLGGLLRTPYLGGPVQEALYRIPAEEVYGSIRNGLVTAVEGFLYFVLWVLDPGVSCERDGTGGALVFFERASLQMVKRVGMPGSPVVFNWQVRSLQPVHSLRSLVIRYQLDCAVYKVRVDQVYLAGDQLAGGQPRARA